MHIKPALSCNFSSVPQLSNTTSSIIMKNLDQKPIPDLQNSESEVVVNPSQSCSPRSSAHVSPQASSELSCVLYNQNLANSQSPGPSTRTTSHAIHNSDYSSQTEYDSPTVYEHWCKNFRKLGWPYPEKPDPSLSESPTQARATLPPSPSPSQDDYLAMPVRAFLEMPSQPMHSQMYGGSGMETPTR